MARTPKLQMSFNFWTKSAERKSVCRSVRAFVREHHTSKTQIYGDEICNMFFAQRLLTGVNFCNKSANRKSVCVFLITETQKRNVLQRWNFVYGFCSEIEHFCLILGQPSSPSFYLPDELTARITPEWLANPGCLLPYKRRTYLAPYITVERLFYTWHLRLCKSWSHL